MIGNVVTKPSTTDYKKSIISNPHHNTNQDPTTYPEQHLVPPQVLHPLRVRRFRARVHPEQTPAHVDHFPREQQARPTYGGEARRAGAEHGLAPVARVVATPRPEVATAEAPDDEHEGRETDATDDGAVCDHVDDEF